MAKIKVRFLVELRGAQGGLPRYYWQPSAPLRAVGYANRRLPDDWRRYSDAAALRGAAIAAATRLNDALDASRVGAAAARITDNGRQVVAARLPRTLSGLIALYRADEAFTRLKPSTRRGYEQALLYLETWSDDAPVTSLTKKRCKVMLRALRDRPAWRNAVGRVLRIVMEFGVGEDWLGANPATRMGLKGTPKSGMIWPREAVPLFVAAADRLGLPSIGTAILLDEWLGQREGDILRMPVSIYRNGALHFRQSKTGVAVTLPVEAVTKLQDRLEAELGRRDTIVATSARGAARAAKAQRNIETTTILVCEATGLPWRADFFRSEFARVRAEVARTQPHFELDYLLPGRDMADPKAFQIETRKLIFMHLRHTAVTRQAEAGCTDDEISAITGHSLASIKEIKERYRIRTRLMALHAFEKRAAAEGLAPPAARAKREEG